MERYLLLRNNCEAGPFTKEDLKTYGLLSSDLIWIEGESTAWSHPEDIQDLRALAKTGVKQPLPVPNSEAASVSPSLQEYRRALAAERPFAVAGQEKPMPIFTERTGDSSAVKTHPPKKSSLNPNLFGLGVLFIGVMLGAFLLKKMVDSFDDEPSAPSVAAIEIREEALPTSTTMHTAQVTNLPPTPAVTAVENKEALNVKPPTITKPEKILAGETKAKAVVRKETVAETEKMEASPEEDAGASSPEENVEATATASKTPSLQVSANDYKVGLFGGISNLEINVSNPSSQSVGKAIIEIEYLKPNGNVVKTQTVTVDQIAAGDSKSVSVPSTGRGVKIRYRVVSAER